MTGRMPLTNNEPVFSAYSLGGVTFGRMPYQRNDYDGLSRMGTLAGYGSFFKFRFTAVNHYAVINYP